MTERDCLKCGSHIPMVWPNGKRVRPARYRKRMFCGNACRNTPTNRHCKRCGKIIPLFFPGGTRKHYASSVFCSTECVKKSPPDRNCRLCGKIIPRRFPYGKRIAPSYYRKRVFCSEKCRRAKKSPDRKCNGCGKIIPRKYASGGIKTRYYKAKSCSKKCQWQMQRLHPPDRYCECCGNIIPRRKVTPAKYSKLRFCGVKCYNKSRPAKFQKHPNYIAQASLCKRCLVPVPPEDDYCSLRCHYISEGTENGYNWEEAMDDRQE